MAAHADSGFKYFLLFFQSFKRYLLYQSLHICLIVLMDFFLSDFDVKINFAFHSHNDEWVRIPYASLCSRATREKFYTDFDLATLFSSVTKDFLEFAKKFLQGGMHLEYFISNYFEINSNF
jgi:hypothetical protein